MADMRKSIILLALLVPPAFLVAGCTDSEVSSLKAYGSKFRVTVYSGGVAVKTYTSTGRVASLDASDGWEFRDAATNKFVRVTGTVTVEEVE